MTRLNSKKTQARQSKTDKTVTPRVSGGKMSGGRVALAGLTLAMLALAGCGGGGGGGSSAAADNTQTTVAAAQIRGTAASGAPVVGEVTIKDANGQERTVSTDAQGAYTMNVEGLTAPFMLKVEGQVGGRAVTLYSVATTGDVGGVVNITTLSDVITANVLGGIPATAYASANFGALTAQKVEKEKEVLKKKLETVLTSLGVTSSNYDPLHTAFEVLNSKEDKILDVVKVNYDPTTRVATIKNIVDGQEIEDDLQVGADEEEQAGLPGFGGSEDLSVIGDDIDALRAAVGRINAVLGSSLMGEERYLALSDIIDAGLLLGGQNKSQVVSELASDQLIGARITDVEFVSRRVLNGGGQFSPVLMKVNAVLRSAGGAVLARLDNQIFVRDSGSLENTQYTWYGDLRDLEMSVDNMSRRRVVQNNGQPVTCYDTGIDFTVSDVSGGGRAADVAYVSITGPGLAEPVQLFRSNGDNRWTGPGLDGGHFLVLNSSCVSNAEARGVADGRIRALPNNAQYSVVAYGDNGQVLPYGLQEGGVDWTLHTHGLRPYTTQEAQGATYANVINLDSIFSGWGTSGNESLITTVNATGVNDGFQTEVYGKLTYSGAELYQTTQQVSAMGAVTTTLDVSEITNIAVLALDAQEVSVTTWDMKGRQLMSTWVNLLNSNSGLSPVIGPNPNMAKSKVKRTGLLKVKPIRSVAAR